MHIMTDSSDFNDVDDADEGPSNPNLKPKETGTSLVQKDDVGHDRHGSADSINSIRLEKDQPTGEGENEGAIESSEDEEDAKSSDEEDEPTSDRKRGRGRSRAEKASGASRVDLDESEDDPYASLYGQNKSTSQAKSVLAAAEEERRFN
jgi:hypothetical protein